VIPVNTETVMLTLNSVFVQHSSSSFAN